jgi:hypothetical protein
VKQREAGRLVRFRVSLEEISVDRDFWISVARFRQASDIMDMDGFLLLDFGCMLEEPLVFSHGLDNIQSRKRVSFCSVILTR